MKKLQKFRFFLELLYYLSQDILAYSLLASTVINAFHPTVQEEVENDDYNFSCSIKQEVTADGVTYIYDFLIEGGMSPFQVTAIPYLRITDQQSGKTLLVIFSNVFSETTISSNDGHCIVCSYIDIHEVENMMAERIDDDVNVEVNVICRYDYTFKNQHKANFLIVNDGLAVAVDNLEDWLCPMTVTQQDLFLYPERQSIIIDSILKEWRELN